MKASVLCLLSIAALAAAAFVSTPAQAQDAPNIWVARFSAYKSKSDCAYGTVNCNRCVYNVEEQFRDLTQRSAHSTTVHYWRASTVPAFNDLDISHHYQSFVRVPNDNVGGAPNLFATFSDSWIFGSRAESKANGATRNGELNYQQHAAGAHPGGMQAIGHYVLIATEKTADGEPKLEIINTDVLTDANQRIPLTGMTGAANVAVTMLASGGYLLALERSSYHADDYRLFYTASLTDVHLEPVLPKVRTDWDTGFKNGSDDQNGFENLSMIAECGTGKTFLVGTTAPDILVDEQTTLYLFGKSVWALYEVVPGNDVVFRFVTKNSLDMYSPECDPRAAGTAFAGRYGQLGLYCHQKTQSALERQQIPACGLSFLFGLPSLTAAFCGSLAFADPKLMFTEYWPNATYEAPVEPLVDVTVSILPGAMTRLGVIEETTGNICEATLALKTCVWKVPQGSTLTLTPYRMGGLENRDILWIDNPSVLAASGPCSSAYTDGNVSACTLTPTAPLSVGLWEYVLQ